MIDSPKVLRDYLAGQSAITDLTSTRLYAELTYPRPGYSPNDDGACLVFRRRGGKAYYSSKLLEESYMFKCYAVSEEDANALYRALYDTLHDYKGNGIAYAGIEITGQTLADMATGWPYVLCYYMVTFRITS